jgi:hypothetical protein
MIKKDDLEEFLFLFNKAETIPFTNFEDTLANNFNALDIPFKDYSNSIIFWSANLKLEISENLLSIAVDDKLPYLKYLINKLKLESWKFDNKNIFDILKYYDVDTAILDFNKNTPLKELLNKNFKSVSGFENLNKFRDLHREYYKYFLNIERDKIFKYVNGLIENLDSKNESSDEEYKNTNWFIIGLLFANGEMDTLLKKYKSNGTQIAKHLGNEKGFRPYITESIGSNIKTSKKNIFSDRDKMQKIITHCEDNNIPVIPFFKEHLPTE